MFFGLQKRISASASDDELKLGLLGYKQELRRQLSAFHNFAVAFSYLSPITGLTGTYGFAFAYGGPVSIMWGWIIVCFFNIFVGLSLAEICSAYPTSGGVYFFAHKLAGPKSRNISAWLTAWFNMLGEIGATAGVAYTTAILVANFVLLSTGTATGGGWVADQYVMFGIYCGVLLLLGLVNTFGVKALAFVGNFSVWFHVIAGTVFVVALPLVAPTHQSASYVFTEFVPNPGTGVTNNTLLFMLGLLGAQWAMVGYDSAAHMAEETQGADVSGPLSLMVTILSGFVVGFVFLLAVTFSIQDPAMVLSYDNAVGGSNAVMYITWEAFMARYGSGLGGLLLMVVPLVCSVFCGNACVTACSRSIFAFSRDNGLPGSRLWKQVHPYFGAPTNAVWLCVSLCVVIGLPILHSYVAFAAITSIGVIGLYLSYLIPLILRVTSGRNLPRGPFTLGGLSIAINLVAIVWMLFACVIFILPQVVPVTPQSLNYAPVAVGIVLLISCSWFYLFGARKWFKGPVANLADAEADGKAVDADLDGMAVKVSAHEGVHEK